LKQKRMLKLAYRTALCLALCFVMLCSTMSVATAGSTKGSAQDLGQSGTVQSHLDGIGTAEWYKITPNASQYYRFTFHNQSVETRLGISIADSLLNLFLGKMSIVIYDSYDAILAEGDVKCGYTGSVSLRLEKGQTYYIKLTSTVAGNYRLTTTYFADIGANSWSGAEDVLSNGQFISAIDADGDTDWFKFVADEEQSFYRFYLENINGSGNKSFHLYEHVPGAGEFPLRAVWNFSVSKGNTGSKDAQLKEGHTYYYCISGSVGGYQLNVSQTLDVAGPDFETAYEIERDQKYTTSFDGSGDMDYFKFETGSEDAYYHFRMESLFSDSSYIYYYLYDNAGNKLVGSDFYSNSGSRNFNFRLEPNSTYYFGMKKNSDTIGNYNFKITTQPDAYPNEQEQSVTIQTETEYTTSFDGYGDVDCFKFVTGAKDAYYHFEMKSLFGDGSYIYYYLYDDAGNKLVGSDFYSNNGSKKFNFRLEPNSTYYFSMKKNSDTIGNYTFKILTQPDTYPNEQEQSVTIQTDKEYTTSFDGYGDVDCFKFVTGAKDAYYHFEMKSLFGDGSYIYYYLYDDAGNKLVGSDFYSNNGSKKFNFRLEPNSTYYFSMKKNSDTIGNYIVKISTQLDAYPNTMEQAVLIQEGVTYNSSFDGYGDEDWFKFVTGNDSAYYNLNVSLSFSDGSYIQYYRYDEAGTRLGNMETYAGSFPMVYDVKLEPNSTYYYCLKRNSDTPGKYTIKMEKVADTEGDTMDRAQKIQLNELGMHFLASESDVDWLVVTVDYDNDYRFRVINESGGNLDVQVYNQYEKWIAGSNWGFSSELEKVLSLSAGRYYIKVTRYSGSPKYYTLVMAECASTHQEKVTYPTKATTERDGVKRTVCSYCGAVIKTEKVARLSSVKLTKSKWTCTGKTLTPTIKVVDANGKTVSSSYYTLKTSATGKTPGKYTVTVTFKGKYSGTKKLTYYVVLGTPKVEAKGNGSSIKVTWGKVPAATTYVVYRRQYVSGKWSSWTKVTTTKTTSYTHSSPTTGRLYRYAVKAYCGSEVSEMGSSVSAVKLSKPTSVKAKGKTAGITISWKKVTGAKGYYIYARKYSGGKWGSWSKIKVTTSTSYTHKTASYGVNYQYRIRAYYEDSVSADSASVSAIRLKAPTGVKSKKSGSAIKTSWNKVTGASGYVVYRRTYNTKTGKYGSWVKVKTTTARSYTDKKAKKGTTYQYSVTAYKSSHVSDRKSGSKVKR